MSELPTALAHALAAGFALFTAGLFTLSFLHKIRTFNEFTGFLAGYRLLPATLVRGAAGLIVLLEGAGAIALLVSLPVLAYLPSGLLVLYAVAMGINLRRGRSDIDCGCGGTPMPLSTALVLRNLLLAAAAGWAAARSPAIHVLSPLTLGGVATVAGFAACLGILYAAFNQLQANRAVYRRLWTSAP